MLFENISATCFLFSHAQKVLYCLRQEKAGVRSDFLLLMKVFGKCSLEGATAAIMYHDCTFEFSELAL